MSDGEPTSQSESVYQETKELNRRLNNTVVIYTYAIGKGNINAIMKGDSNAMMKGDIYVMLQFCA